MVLSFDCGWVADGLGMAWETLSGFAKGVFVGLAGASRFLPAVHLLLFFR